MKAWIVRDFNRKVYLHFDKPIKAARYWTSFDAPTLIKASDLPNTIRPKWTDTEPIEVNLSIVPLNNQPSLKITKTESPTYQ